MRISPSFLEGKARIGKIQGLDRHRYLVCKSNRLNGKNVQDFKEEGSSHKRDQAHQMLKDWRLPRFWGRVRAVGVVPLNNVFSTGSRTGYKSHISDFLSLKEGIYMSLQFDSGTGSIFPHDPRFLSMKFDAKLSWASRRTDETSWVLCTLPERT